MTRRLLLLGTGTLAHAVCEGLLAGGVVPVAVMTRAEGNRRERRAEPMQRSLLRLLTHARIPRLERLGPDRATFRDLLERLEVDCVLMAGWGDILPGTLLARPDIDFLNCHPSALPAHRGPNPYAAAIRAGDTSSGVSIHRVDAGIDTGPVLLQESLAVLADDTGGGLRDRCGALARELAIRLTDLLAAGPLPAGTPQSSLGTPSLHHRMHEDEAWLDWRWPAERLGREVRALQPWLTGSARFLARGPWRLQIRSTAVLAAPNSAATLEPGSVCATSGPWPCIRCGDTGQVLHLRQFGVAVGDRGLPAPVARRLARRLLTPGPRLLLPAPREDRA